MWHDIEGLVTDFMRLGFEFRCDDSMAKHHKEPVVEISVTFPEEIAGSGTPLRFEGVAIWSDSISTNLATQTHNEALRVILTTSEALTDSARLVFHFVGPAEPATRGVRYILPMKAVVMHWRNQKTAEPGAIDNPDDVRGVREDQSIR